MKNESIDDIFEGIDLNDEELLKKAEKVANFKPKAEILCEKPATETPKPKITSDYFYILSGRIKRDWDYVPIKGLLVNRHYDRTYDGGLCEKYELKRDVFAKISIHRLSERSHMFFMDVVDTLNELKDNELFFGDYFPYKTLVEFYARNGKYKEGISEIREFLNSDIHVSEVILAYFRFYSEYFHERIYRKDTLDFSEYEGSVENAFPLAEQIFSQRGQCYVISREKYEFNQALILLLVKSVSAKYLKYRKAVRFYVDLSDCEILYFKALAYSMLGFFCDRMKSSDKFFDYYMDGLRLKGENGNALEEDFERIFSCAQIRIDFENSEERSLEAQFDELFGEFRK